MRWKLSALAAALTTMFAANASAASVAATPCASGASIERASAAMALLLPSPPAPSATGVVLLDCVVGAGRRLSCTAPNQTEPRYDLRAAALAFAGELEVCPGTPRRLMFPLTFRLDDAPRSDPSP